VGIANLLNYEAAASMPGIVKRAQYRALIVEPQ
jgi:hypothetical protein